MNQYKYKVAEFVKFSDGLGDDVLCKIAAQPSSKKPTDVIPYYLIKVLKLTINNSSMRLTYPFEYSDTEYSWMSALIIDEGVSMGFDEELIRLLYT